MPVVPVETIPGDDPDRAPAPGIGLCLSGGGYRAMVFHVGVLWRLYEAGVLSRVDRVSSVSGGSITAAVLALKWTKLSFNPDHVRSDFVPEVVAPIRALAGQTIDVWAIILGILLPGRISDRIAAAYQKHLFGNATLQDLPDQPRFVINATNVQSGALWRFMKPYMRDYRVGNVDHPNIPLSRAVAASSAFPPFLSPVEMRLNEAQFTPKSGQDLQRAPFTTRVILTDGGVYDNLGLEPVWKRYQTVLVSDGGGKMPAEEAPKSDWLRHAHRVLDVVDNQVRSLRKQQVIGSFKAPQTDQAHRKGAYWGIRTNIADYKLADPLSCPHDRTMDLAETPTRLKRLDSLRQERLINWGYAVCDAALRRHVDPEIAEPAGFPYPAAGV
ncbi:MAG TPA: patatin-like phospholipase family protein [Vineibacter sp.]|nr:patatin-like phospholipase family protein [Vineibacter sp.]